MTQQQHRSVLLEESVQGLQITADAWYIDATFGRGGHTRSLLDANARVIAFDWDHEAIRYGEELFTSEIAEKRLILIHQSFEHLTSECSKLELDINSNIAGCLFDFGTSTEQLTSGVRGFSLYEDGPLDMRMDVRLQVQAKDILAAVPEKQLAELFSSYGGEDESRAIAKAIKRHSSPISTTSELAAVVTKAKRRKSHHLHPATKVFQALRIAVNSELEAISKALPQALELIKRKGRIVTIAFHDGEDRIVKQQFRDWQTQKLGTNVTTKPISPSQQEVTVNPRSRSAKLRIFEKE